MEMLRKTSGELYGERDPNTIFHQGRAQNFEKVGGQYKLSFDFPLSSKEEIDLTRNGDELIIRLGAYRRNIILPRSIANLPVKGARFESGKLVVSFGKKSPVSQKK